MSARHGRRKGVAGIWRSEPEPAAARVGNLFDRKVACEHGNANENLMSISLALQPPANGNFSLSSNLKGGERTDAGISVGLVRRTALNVPAGDVRGARRPSGEVEPADQLALPSLQATPGSPGCPPTCARPPAPSRLTPPRPGLLAGACVPAVPSWARRCSAAR